MGMFDDAMKGSVPGGDVMTPIAIAAGALLLHHWMGSGSSPAPQAAPQVAPPTAPDSEAIPPDPTLPTSGGGVLDGLNNILGKLTSAGHGEVANSWVGNGPNQPIQPGSLGNALGQDTLDQLAAKTGLTKEQLLAGLSTVLPQLINKLTPNGRLPTSTEVGA
jgi:uncharacterized protein YidB (DUF937 family)